MRRFLVNRDRERDRRALVIFWLVVLFAIAITALVLGIIGTVAASSRNARSDTATNNFYFPRINIVNQNTVDITGTETGNPASYQYVGIIRGGTIEIDSQETPSGTLPLFNSAFFFASFPGGILDGDVVVNAFYSGPSTVSTLLAIAEFRVIRRCYVDVITEQPIPFANGDFLEYPFQIDPNGTIFNTYQEAFDFLGNPALQPNDVGCFIELKPTAFTGTSTNIAVQIVPRRMIFTYSTAGGTVEFANLGHSVVSNNCGTPSVIPTTQDFFIDYGDGTARNRVTGTLATTDTHVYSGAPPLVNVTIYGILPNWSHQAVIIKNAGGLFTDLINVVQWGNTGLVQVDFKLQLNLETIYAGAPPSTVTDMSFFIELASANTPPANKAGNAMTGWDLSQVQSFASAFANSRLGVDLDISAWGMSSATNLCKAFLQFGPETGISSITVTGLNSWTTTSWVSTDKMFQGWRAGDLVIPSWTLTNLVDGTGMFINIREYDAFTTSWSTPALQIVTQMFDQYNRTLSPIITSWDLSQLTACNDFVDTTLGVGSMFSPTEYDAILNRFAVSSPVSLVCTWNNVQMQYTAAGLAARNTLIGRGWTINDLGPV